jgi:hypothetical protein
MSSKQLQTKEEAIQTVQENNQEYYDLAIEYAEKWIETRFKPFTSEDLSADMYLVLGIPKEPRVLGAVINYLRNKKLIKHNGFSRYFAKQGHGKPCSIWISLRYSQIQAENRRLKTLKLNFEEK